MELAVNVHRLKIQESRLSIIFVQILSANVGDLVELRLSNLEERGSRRSYHSMHMHGYEFFLMSMGFAQYENGTIIGDNENVKCRKTPCAFLDYDEEVLKRQREERNFYIAKNSILVPPQGYAIVRFRYSLGTCRF
jgi:hypothetical protein